MTLRKMQELAQANSYYRLMYKGHWVGATSSRMIRIVLRRNNFDLDFIKHLGFCECSFMEYISLNQGYCSKNTV
jgi:predicted nucleic acid-binding Zn finger protein